MSFWVVVVALPLVLTKKASINGHLIYPCWVQIADFENPTDQLLNWRAPNYRRTLNRYTVRPLQDSAMPRKRFRLPDFASKKWSSHEVQTVNWEAGTEGVVETGVKTLRGPKRSIYHQSQTRNSAKNREVVRGWTVECKPWIGHFQPPNCYVPVHHVNLS